MKISLDCALNNTRLAHSEPTVFENYVHDLYVDEQLIELSLWDTAGKWGYKFECHLKPERC